MRFTWLFGAALVTLSAAWAWRPLEQPKPRGFFIDLHPPPTTPIDDQDHRFDQGAFVVRLWNPPPEARNALVAGRTAPPPKPLRLQLIGIIDDGRQLRAALYDPETDRLLILGDGDHVRQHTITITADAVELADGRVTHRLTLRKDRS
ncbi:MAG: hypothetical protein V3T84_01420 [Phycisphaerales bacterium]